MDRRTFIKTAAAGSLLYPWYGSGRVIAEPLKRPNILFILADQWRASATGYAGDPNVKTPHLDILAGQGLNFINAVSVCPVCTPYRASVLTGRYPTTTGIFMNDLSLPEDELCLAEIFRAAGYETAYIGKWHLDGHGRSSYIPPSRRQGFEYWKAAECDHNYNHSHYYTGQSPEKQYWKGYDAFAQTQDAQAWLSSRKTAKKPFFLFLAYGSPHFPHGTAPEDYKAMYPVESIQCAANVPKEMCSRVRKEAQGYYAHCTALDKCVGDLMETLDQADLATNTIVVFTSDHGEMLGSQGVQPCEKQRPWNESVCVPFVLRHPDVSRVRPRKIQTPINTPDILPTLLGLSGIEIPKTVQGADLSGLIFGSESETDCAALIMSVSPFAGYHKGKEFRGIRTSRYTFVCDLNGPWLLYDNQNDPMQLQNLVQDQAWSKLLLQMEERLQRKLDQIGDPFKPREYYLEKWGYQVDIQGCIPYSENHRVQGPKT